MRIGFSRDNAVGEFVVSASDASTPSVKTYRVGTLNYTTWSLANLFIWLLWGDFCYTLLESMIPRLLPLMLKDMNASNGLIGFMVGSVPAILNISVLPALSVRSDRYRSRRGRRIPFLLVVTPLVSVSLIAVGYYDTLGSWLHHGVLSRVLSVSPTGFLLVLLGVLVAGFQFFNVFMIALYNCLFADVVPQVAMGRFLSLFRAVNTLAAFLFSRYVLGLSGAHRREIFLAVGILYFVAFMLMCWRVREGEYPPPVPAAGGPGLWASCKSYLRECFMIPFYLWVFLALTLGMAANCVGPFHILFYREVLHLSLDDIGKLYGWTYLAMSISFLFCGYICDKINPLRFYLTGLVLLMVLTTLAYFLVHDWNTVLTFAILCSVGNAFFGLGLSAIPVALFPREKFGQYNSALGISYAISMVGGNYLGGVFIDHFGQYRLVYLWVAASMAAAIVPTLRVYRLWKQYGGPAGYVPPSATERKVTN